MSAWAAVGMAALLAQMESDRRRASNGNGDARLVDYMAHDVKVLKTDGQIARVGQMALEQRIDKLEQAALVLASEVRRLAAEVERQSGEDADLWRGVQRLSRIANGREGTR